MRNEYIDMSEFVRRVNEEIYDKEEFNRALKWVKENCKEGPITILQMFNTQESKR